MLRTNNPGYRFLVTLWSAQCPLTQEHLYWIKRFVQVKNLHKDEYLYVEGDGQKTLFLVSKGAIGNVMEHKQTGRRLIHSVALPGMALTTTNHLYSWQATLGDIIILHADTQVLAIPYRPIKELAEYDDAIGCLLRVLICKSLEQIFVLRKISFVKKPHEQCRMFAEELPELYQILRKQEIADMLNICRNTVQTVSAELARKSSKN